ncbi:MAG: AAA family ATPase [Nocardioides sp.]
MRHGSVCVDLAAVGELAAAAAAGLTVPEPRAWLAAVAASALTRSSVVHVEHGQVYLDRFWREEEQVSRDLASRADRPAPRVDTETLASGAARGSSPRGTPSSALRPRRRPPAGPPSSPGAGHGQDHGCRGAAGAAGGAGGGGEPAPGRADRATGKAAARLQEAVGRATASLPASDRARLGELPAATLHRLLGARPDSRTRFRHHRGNRLPHDVVVVDETSMVSLTMMARLLESLRPETRLVLVGDPDQLASVEAGAVLADLVAGLGERDPGAVASLGHLAPVRERIGALAAAVRSGDDAVALELLRAGGPEVEYVDADPADAVHVLRPLTLAAALAVRAAAETAVGDAAVAASERHRLLCAHREARRARRTGTARSSAGWARSWASRSALRWAGSGMSAGRCW